MNLSFRLHRACAAVLALASFAGAAQAQSSLVPLLHRHIPVQPRVWPGGVSPAIGPHDALPSWTPTGPLVPRALPTRPGAPARLGLSALAAAPAPTPDWFPIGPQPLLNADFGFFGYYGNVSGRVSALAVDPVSAQTFYVGAAGGGVWKTINGGQNYTPLTDFQPDMAIGALAVAPTNRNRLYVGTGEANFSLDSRYGLGVLVSTDAGANFTVSTGPNNAFVRNAISRIVVDPNNANTVYLSTAGGSDGVFKSVDGGTSWVQAFASGGPATDLVIDPGNTQVLYVAVGDPFTTSATNGVYKSTDGGATWVQSAAFRAAAADLVGRISLGIGSSAGPGVPNTVYASVSASDTLGLLYVRKTTDGGATWTTPGTAPNYLGGQGWYDNTIAVDPLDANLVYAAGVINYGGATGNGIIASPDGGVNWFDFTTSTDSIQTAPHTDSHALIFDASNKLIIGNDGGVWRLEDPTQNASIAWTDLNSDLNTMQLTGIALHPTDRTIAYGGAQDNGTFKFDKNPVWLQVRGGDGGFVRVDQDTPETVYHTYFGISLERSDDGGVNWSGATNGIGPDPSNFYTPYILDPSQQTRVIFGTNHVYESTNSARSFTAIGTPGVAGFNPGRGAVVDSLGTSGQTVYASTSVGRLFVTEDDGVTWNERGVPGNSSRLGDIFVDPRAPQTVYVVVSAFSGGTGRHVFRSVDAGQTWSDISGTGASALPDQPYNAIKVDVQDNNIYVGGDDGVYVSTDSGANWARLGTALPNVQVADLVLNQTNRTLGAGTHGRGVWLIALPGAAGVPNLVAQVALRRTRGGVLSAVLTMRNIGTVRATNVTIDTFTLDGQDAAPSTNTVGNLAAFASATPVTVATPDATSGNRVTIRVTGTFGEGSYNNRVSVVVP